MNTDRFRPLYPKPETEKVEETSEVEAVLVDGGVRPTVEDFEERYLTPKDAAALLSVARNTIYLMVREGELPAARLGSAIRIKQSDLVKMMEEKTK